MIHIPHLHRLTGLRLQFAVLSTLIAVNGAFGVPLPTIAATFAAGAAAQYAGCRLAGIPPRFISALITCCSLTLLLRVPGPGWAALAAVLAVSSKFLLRADGKHVFNPANLALTCLLLFDLAWISPGQWGAFGAVSSALAVAGLVINARVGRYDMSLVFISGWVGLLFWRAYSLGDPYTIPLHALESAGVPLFSFFMLPDPASTPASRPMRLLFAVCVLAAGWIMQVKMFIPEGFVYALTGASAVRGVILLLRERLSIPPVQPQPSAS